MRKILLPVDETEASRRAADFVERFFDDLEVSVTALNVARAPVRWMAPAAGYWWAPIPFGGVAPWPGIAGTEPVGDATLAEEERQARMIAADQAPAGADVEVAFGDVADTIAQVAAEEHADLIVVGSRHKGVLQRWFGRSVSEDVADHAPCPVLVVD